MRRGKRSLVFLKTWKAAKNHSETWKDVLLQEAIGYNSGLIFLRKKKDQHFIRSGSLLTDKVFNMSGNCSARKRDIRKFEVV